MDSENSSDIELTLDISEENIEDECENMELDRITSECLTLKKHNLKRKCGNFDIGAEINSPNSLDNDLNNTAHLIEETFASDDFDKADEFDSSLNENTHKLYSCNSKLNSVAELPNSSTIDNQECNVKKLLLNVAGSVQDNLENKDDENSSKSINPSINNHDVLTCSSDSNPNENGICNKPNNISNSNRKNSDSNVKSDSKLNKNVDLHLEEKNKNIAPNEVRNGSYFNVHDVHREQHKKSLPNGTVGKSEFLGEQQRCSALPKTSVAIEADQIEAAKKDISNSTADKICDITLNKTILNQRSGVVNGDILPPVSKFDISNTETSVKRKLSLPANDKTYQEHAESFPSHSFEKCPKIDNILNKVNSISENDKKESTDANVDKKKKPSLNTARKHTSSRSEKVVNKIDQILLGEFKKQENKSNLNGDIFVNIEKLAESKKSTIDNSNSVNENSQDHDARYKIKLKMNELSEDSLKNIFKTMRKRLTRRQLEEIIIQKCCEVISESSEIGELKKQVTELQQAEGSRKHTVADLEKKIFQLRGVCNVFMRKVDELRNENRISPPTVITRSVGLQVAYNSSPFVRNDASSSTTPCSNEDHLRNSSTIPVRNSKVNYCENESPNCSKRCPSPTSCTAPDSRTSSSSTINENNEKTALSFASGNSDISFANPNSTILSKRSNSAAPVLSDPAIIDLTDKDDKSDSNSTAESMEENNPLNHASTSNQPNVARNNLQVARSKNHSESQSSLQHPAPLPPTPVCSKSQTQYGGKRVPSAPELKIYKTDTGISLSWNMDLTSEYANIAKYQIYAYQATSAPANVEQWKSVGDVNALPLPMACTLTELVIGYTYHFTVRAVDVYGRIGPFSLAKSIAL